MTMMSGAMLSLLLAVSRPLLLFYKTMLWSQLSNMLLLTSKLPTGKRSMPPSWLLAQLSKDQIKLNSQLSSFKRSKTSSICIKTKTEKLEKLLAG